MSKNLTILHSHSGLERNLKFPQSFVLVDEEFSDMFDSEHVKPFKHNRIVYLKVPILMFVNKGGVFKNLDA